MISGAVNSQNEAVVQLTVMGAGALSQALDFMIDTGFSGHLTLPASLIGALKLVWIGREQGTLADGSLAFFDVYRAAVLWDGRVRLVEINKVDSQPILGMGLLARHSLHLDIIPNGAIAITALTVP